MKIKYSDPKDGFKDWKKYFIAEFINIMGDDVPVDYDELSEDCLRIYGLGVCPLESAQDQASYYD